MKCKKVPKWLKERKNAVKLLEKHGVTSLQMRGGKKHNIKDLKKEYNC